MSRGRKTAKSSINSDWKRIFRSSLGFYFQSLLVGLASHSPADSAQKRTQRLKNTLPAIQDSEKPFPLPENWNWYRLGELCDYGNSKKAEPKTLTHAAWVLDLEDIEKDTSTLIRKVRFSERNSLSTKSVFGKGDVLYSKLRPYLDKVIVADEDGVCTTEILPLSFSDDNDPNFLLLTLKLRSFLEFVNSVTRGMKMPRLGTKQGKMALVPLPPLSVQKEIVRFVEDFENNELRPDSAYFNANIERNLLDLQNAQLSGSLLSSELADQLELVRQLRQAFLREAMQGKLVPQDDADEPAEILLKKIKAEKAKLIAEKKIKKEKPLPEIKPEEIPFEIPSSWECVRIGTVTNFIDYRGKTPNKREAGVKLITAKNVKFGRFSSTPEEFISDADRISHMTRGIPKNGDILFTTEAPLGNACLLNYDQPFALAQRIITIQPILFDNRFLLSLILSDVFQRQLITKASGATAKGIKSSRLITLLLPLPPLAEQKRIVEKLEKLVAFCDELEANIRESKHHAETLLQVALKEALEPK